MGQTRWSLQGATRQPAVKNCDRIGLREYLLRWLLASFLAGWHGDVDPVKEDENVTWLNYSCIYIKTFIVATGGL